MKTIPYVVKSTKSNIGTVYYKTLQSDLDWIIVQCDAIVNMDTACRDSGDPELISASDELNAPNKNMPRQTEHGFRPNSVRSMCEGVIKNFKTGTQYDLSSKTATGITEAFKVASEIFTSFEPVEFVKVETLPKKEPLATMVTDIYSKMPYNDLFELELVQPAVFRLVRKQK